MLSRLSSMTARVAARSSMNMSASVFRFGTPSMNTARMFSTEGTHHGTVKWFDPSKGFGFVVREDDQGDIFVHFSAIAGDGYRSLEEGQRVSFSIGMGPKGAVATDVTIIG